MSARDTALGVLIRCRTQNAWADAALAAALSRDGLSGPEAALCSRLVYGVVQNRLLLDFELSAFCTQKLERLQPPLLEILRLGAYQILFLDKVPDSAAVNTAVELAKKHRRAPAAGLVNAVLRKISQNREKLPVIPDRDEAKYLSIRYSHPKWLVKRLLALLGRTETEQFLAANNGIPPLTVQVNPLKTTVEELVTRLKEEGVAAQAHPWVPGCLELIGAGNPANLRSFQEGLFLVQDAAAALAAQLCGAKAGERLLDVCAAPGGKSFSNAFAMQDQGEIVACDIHENKLRHIREGAARLGLSSVSTCAADGRTFRPEWESSFDVVLVDAPRSGLGIIRKKPDARYKNPDSLFTLPMVQSAILNNAARYVRPGGRLVYSTCTILPEENEQMTAVFLSEHPDFSLEKATLPQSAEAFDGHITLWPQRHQTDGFYICRMRRRAAHV